MCIRDSTTGAKLPPWSNSVPTIVIRNVSTGVAVVRNIGFLYKAQLYSAIMGALGIMEAGA